MIKYKKFGKGYVLKEILTIETGIRIPASIRNKHSTMGVKGKITLYPGFYWDGATGAIDTDDILEASAFHDFICNAYNKGKLTKEHRKLGDKMFKGKLKETDMWEVRIKYIYQFVRKFFETKEWFKKITK
jgi:hypothetical protein